MNVKCETLKNIGKPEELVEIGVTFVNGEGRVILLGVGNRANIIGFGQRDYEDIITNILFSGAIANHK